MIKSNRLQEKAREKVSHWLLSERCIRLTILLAGAYSSFLYALRHFEIISDSGREYEVYLIFVKQGHWSPIAGNMLPSCLWTTYLPSLIQNAINLVDPSIVYRVTLAILIAPLPLVVYLLLRRYTTIGISALLTAVVYTSFYYQASVSYARGQVALIIACLLLMILPLHNRKWWHLPLLAIIGCSLTVAHYTTAFIYAGMLIGAGGLLLFVKWLGKRKWNRQALILLLCGLALVGMERLWYGLTFHGAQLVADGMLTTIIEDSKDLAVGVQGIVAIPGTALILSTTSNMSSAIAPTVTPSQAIGIALAQWLLILRILLQGAVLVMLQRSKKLWTAEGVLLLGSLLAISIALVVPRIDYWVGALRIGYTLLPIQLVGIAYWWEKNRNDKMLIPVLALWAIVYH